MSTRLDWLTDLFHTIPDHTFLVWRDQRFSYKWLLDRISEWQGRLDHSGVRSGTVVSIESDYSPDSIALFLALIERGTIIVPLTPSIIAQRNDFRQIAEVQAVITPGEGNPITILQPTPVRNTLLKQLAEKGAPGLVLFSSGSTGQSKAVLHNLSFLLKKFQTRRYSLTTLAFLMLDHIGGINTLLYVLSNGGTLVCVESREPDAVCAAIAQYQVQLLPTSPTFLNLLLISEAHRRHDLSSLRRVTYGTEVMHEFDRMHALLPNVELQQTYGLSELGILRSKSRTPDSLWVKVGGEDFERRCMKGHFRLRRNRQCWDI